jgi:hypothetical protein
MLRSIILTATAAMAATIVTPAAAGCTMSPAEQGWVDGSLQAWSHMAKERLHLAPSAPPTIIVFIDKCRVEATATETPRWKGEPHRGKIRLPDGSEVPVGVVSAASHDDKSNTTFFVMALPPVWEAAGIPISRDSNGLRGVFLHEFAHTRHTAALKPAFQAAAAIQPMPEDLDDDGVQKRFGTDPVYAAVAEKEMRLLAEAAHETDAAKARELAKQALSLMEARQQRWFNGPDAVWKHYDDIFLTMEGLGQWVAYSWLADPKGGGLTQAAAEEKMRGRKRWWTQEEGLSLFLLVDRFVPDWTQRAFAKAPALGIDLLKIAVAEDNQE